MDATFMYQRSASVGFLYTPMPRFVHSRNVVCSPRGSHFRGLEVMHICFARAGITDQPTLCELTQIVLRIPIARRAAA